MLKLISTKGKQWMVKGYAKASSILSNERGNNNTTAMFWILGGAVIFALALGFIKGWIPELFDSIKSKVSQFM